MDKLSLLFEERKLVLDMVFKTEQMMFLYISVVIAPVATLFGYSIVNTKSNLFLFIPLYPLLLLISILILLLLYANQDVGSVYNRYLAEEINKILGQETIALEKLYYHYHMNGITTQKCITLAASLLITGSFTLSASLINDALFKLYKHINVEFINLFIFKTLYWIIFSLFIAITICAIIMQHFSKYMKIQRMLKSLQNAKLGNDS